MGDGQKKWSRCICLVCVFCLWRDSFSDVRQASILFGTCMGLSTVHTSNPDTCNSATSCTTLYFHYFMANNNMSVFPYLCGFQGCKRSFKTQSGRTQHHSTCHQFQRTAGGVPKDDNGTQYHYFYYPKLNGELQQTRPLSFLLRFLFFIFLSFSTAHR